MSRTLYVYQDQLFEVIHDFQYTGEPEEFTLQPDTYLMMCYGARGGRMYSSDSGRDQEKPYGGLSMGILNLAETTTMYAVVGGDGANTNSDKVTFAPGGYNGGGRGGLANTTSYYGGPGGGGASDVRLNIDPDEYIEHEVTLPAQYSAMEYLFGIQDKYIDTGYHVNHLTTMEFEFYADNSAGGNSYQNLVGCDNNATGYNASDYWPTYSFMIRTSSIWRYRFNCPGCQQIDIATDSTDPALYNTRVIVNMGETEATWHENGSDTIYHSSNDDHTTFAPVDFDNASYPVPSLGVFGVHRATGTGTPFWNDPANAKIYYLTIREDDSDVHKFIPAVKTENGSSISGFYDIIGDTFIEYEQRLNKLPCPVDTTATVNDVTFTVVNGEYTISGTASDNTTYRFPLLETCNVPDSKSYGGPACVHFRNTITLPSGFSIKFGYDDGTTATIRKTYSIDDLPNDTYVLDYTMSDLRNTTVNFIEFTVNSGVTTDISLGLMIYCTAGNSYGPGNLPFSPYNYTTIPTRTFTYKTKSTPSLNSRIIVAGGGGGGQFWEDTIAKMSDMASGGGVFGGYPNSDSGFNRYRYPTQTNGWRFGRGQDGLLKHNYGTSNCGAEGEPGGGGGWYGGYCTMGVSNREHTIGCGGGGSGYVLTTNSYKPSGYMDGYTMSDYYFSNIFMESARSDTAKIIIARKVNNIRRNDVVYSICTGRMEQVSLPPGTYRLECNGGWGNARRYGRESEGGYAAGTLTLDTDTNVFMVAGGSPAHAVTADISIAGTYWNTRFPTATYNGGNVDNYSSRSGCWSASGGGSDIRLIRPEQITIEKSIPDGYTELTYIENKENNRGYINTGYTHKANTIVECKCCLTQNTYQAYQSIFGSRIGPHDSNLNFFMRFDSRDIPVFCCNTYETEGSGLVYGQDITIIVDGTTASWYDSQGILIGSIQSEATEQVDGKFSMFIFNNNTSGNPQTDIGRLKLYSFKMYENGIYKRYLLPCKRDSDDAIGMYDLVTDQFIEGSISTYGYGGLNAGDPVSEKTVVEIVIANLEQSLLSRIIVAGGGAGVGGGNDGKGGQGGGLSGTTKDGGSGYGSNAGPGTQTESPQSGDERARGGFGYGGLGLYKDSGYGGSGGGGWYGGSGTVPDGSGDDDQAGTGGSGYVLTTNSYKPSGYIPDERYYLTDTALIAGGSQEPVGVTSVKITAVEVLAVRILCEDIEGIKSYNRETHEWEYNEEITEITVDTLNQYGTAYLQNDTGLINPYTIYLNDEDDMYDSITISVIPNTLTMKTTIDTPYLVDSCTLDITCDPSLQYTVTTKETRDRIEFKCTFDMFNVPTVQNNIYNIYTTSTNTKACGLHPPIRPYKHLDHIDLMIVGENERVPNRYNDYSDPTLLDGTTPITDIYYSNTLEYNRELYTLMAVNGTTVRLIKFTLISKEYSVLFELPNSAVGLPYSGSVAYIGGFLVDSNYVYITAKTDQKYIIRINRADTTDITKLTVLPTTITGRGKMFWVSIEEFAVATKGGFVIFNTKTQNISDSFAYTSDWDAFDWIATDKYLIKGSTSSNSNLLVYDRVAGTFSVKSQYGTGWQSLCKDDNYIYVGQAVSGGSAVVEILDINTLERVRVVSLPTSNAPETLVIANGTLYYTLADDYNIYLCRLHGDGSDQFKSIRHMYQFKSQSTSNTNNWQMFPCTFKSYYFVPYFKLFTANYRDDIKYNLGYKYNDHIYPVIAQYEEAYEYDPKYITFYDAYANIHPGEFDLELETYDGTIKRCINDIDYRSLIKITLNEKGV